MKIGLQSVSMGLFAASLAASVSGCSESGEPQSGNSPEGCVGGKCDDAEGNIAEELAGRTDPIANYLRAELEAGRLTADGRLLGDYETILEGVARVQGCDLSTTRTFVVSDTLLTDEPFPRIVSTVCTGNKSAEFFVSAPESNGEGEIELQFVEMFAFDKDRDEYVFYETFPTDDEEEMRLNASPTRCQQCHLTPSDHRPDGMRMTPIMNELTQPWTHWNGEPGFISHQFNLPDGVDETDGWQRVVAPYLAPAADLEKLVRRGHFLAAKERRKGALRGPADAIEAMHLMRPLFCSEQVQYVTSKGGQVSDAVLIDAAIGKRLTELGVSAPWYKPAPNDLLQLQTSELLDQVPVRGNADQILENQLVSRGLTSEQLLRVRAIGWHQPVFSDMRCEVWGDAYRRYDGGGARPDLSGAEDLQDALSIVLEDVLSELVQGEDGTFVAIGGDSLDEVRAAFGGGGLGCTPEGVGACLVTAEEFSAMVGAYKESFENDPDADARLRALRDARICSITEQAPVERLPTPQSSGRFLQEADMGRCAEICCGAEGLEPDEEDLQWLSCASDVRYAITDAVAIGGTEAEQCALECGLPTRYANRPSLPEVDGCEPPSFVWPFGVEG